MAPMKYLVLALPFFVLPAAAWADDVCLPTRMSLDGETRVQQDLENERQRPDNSDSLTPMEFFYRHSELEAGGTYTDFASSLALRSNLGFYFRYGVEIFPQLSVQMTYRYAAFTNNPLPEDVHVQALTVGAAVHFPLSPEFALVVGVGVGPMWWDSSLTPSDVGIIITGEIAVTARLWEMLRFKAGILLDGVSTNFHQTSSTWSLDLTYLFGFEIGM
jgi:hypothetical protein